MAAKPHYSKVLKNEIVGLKSQIDALRNINISNKVGMREIYSIVADIQSELSNDDVEDFDQTIPTSEVIRLTKGILNQIYKKVKTFKDSNMAGGLTGVEIASELSAMSLEEEKENVPTVVEVQVHEGPCHRGGKVHERSNFELGTLSQVLTFNPNESGASPELCRGRKDDGESSTANFELGRLTQILRSTPARASPDVNRFMLSPNGFDVIGINETTSSVMSPYLEASISNVYSPIPMRPFVYESADVSMDMGQYTMETEDTTNSFETLGEGSGCDRQIDEHLDRKGSRQHSSFSSDSDFETQVPRSNHYMEEVDADEGFVGWQPKGKKVFHNFNKEVEKTFESIIDKKIDAVKSKVLNKYSKLTLYSFISKLMSMAATKEDMATIKLTAREDSPKIMVCQDEKYRIMGFIKVCWLRVDEHQYRRKLGEIKLKTHIARYMNMKLNNMCKSLKVKTKKMKKAIDVVRKSG